MVVVMDVVVMDVLGIFNQYGLKHHDIRLYL